MIRIYSEKEALENIFLEEDSNKVLSNILYYHSDICLNVSDDDFDFEVEEQDFIFEILKAKGGDGITPYEKPFHDLYEDYNNLVKESQALYFLNIDPQEASDLSSSLGLFVFGCERFNEDLLSYSYVKLLPDGYHCEQNGKIGYHNLLNRQIPPFNSLIISDQYLFKNDQGKRGESNLIQFIEAILPNELNIDFHLMVIAPEHENMNTQSCANLTGRIRTAINNLNLNYKVFFEMVFSETEHKRTASSNTFYINMDKGFATFKSSDNKTVVGKNDFKINGLFVRSGPHQGDTDFYINNVIIEKLSKICASTKEYISNRKEDKNKRIFGDCNKDKSINNRLIQEYL